MIPVQLTPVTAAQLPPTPTHLPPAFQASQVSANFSNVPNAIAVLPAGTILNGFVLNRDPSGNPVLRTAYGDFLLKSVLFLKIGTDVTVKVESSGRNFKAAITAVDGKPVDALSANTPEVSEETYTPARAAPTTTPSPSSTPSVLKGIVLTPSPEAGSPLIKTGTGLRLQITSTSFPGQLPEELVQALADNFSASAPKPLTPATPAATALTETVETATSAASPSTARAGAPTVPPALSPSVLSTTIAKVSETSPLTLTGIVIGKETSGEPIISTPLGLIKITSHITLPTGTQVTLKLSHIYAGGDADAADEIASDNPLTLARQWQSLQGLMDALTTDPAFANLMRSSGLTHLQTASSAAEQSVTLGSGLLFFMSALKGGDLRSWLGEKMVSKLEEKGLDPVLKKAGMEFLGLQKLSGETSPTGWQSTFMPVLVDAQIQMVRMFTKRHRKQKEGGDEGDNTRFVVEMEMSQLGEMQLDGLVRTQAEKKPYLEMVVRAHTPLPTDAQNDILNIFNAAIANAGTEGALHFQWMRFFPVQPLEEAIPQPPDIVA